MKAKQKNATPINEPQPLPPWQLTDANLQLGVSAITELQQFRLQLAARWADGRLRLLASPELRERFDRQAVRLIRAERAGTVAELVEECARMKRAWQALESTAIAIGHQPDGPPDLWETTLPDGRLLVLCRTDEQLARQQQVAGRQAWSLEEVARLIAAQDAELLELKGRFGGVLKQFEENA